MPEQAHIIDEREAPARLEKTAATFTKVRSRLADVIFGQDAVIEQTLVTLLAGGHGLLIGVPGLAKTKLVESLAIVLGLDTSRIQFTPDLMPTDITGSEVMEESASGSRGFRFIRGPVFTQLLIHYLLKKHRTINLFFMHCCFISLCYSNRQHYLKVSTFVYFAFIGNSATMCFNIAFYQVKGLHLQFQSECAPPQLIPGGA